MAFHEIFEAQPILGKAAPHVEEISSAHLVNLGVLVYCLDHDLQAADEIFRAKIIETSLRSRRRKDGVDTQRHGVRFSLRSCPFLASAQDRSIQVRDIDKPGSVHRLISPKGPVLSSRRLQVTR
jgi:hypothetical protein